MIDPANVQLSHWLMAVGTVLVVAGAVGLLLKRRRAEKAPPSKEEADPRVAG